MVPRLTFLLIAMVLFVYSCGPSRTGPPAIGEAFVGPATLNIRDDLALKSKVVATVKHGERLEVLQSRRRFIQVRTPQGAVGWTDSRQLMTPEEMQRLRALADAGRGLPSQGSATVFEALNVHTEPTRTSPSFAQIPETGKVDIIAHKVMPRTAATTKTGPIVPKKAVEPVTRKKRKEVESRKIPPPPMPPPPKPPANWLELSRQQADEDDPNQKKEPEEAETPQKPVPMEDWSLIRLQDGRVGWVLLRMLNLSIPDEVAQYAEGHRITSYFALSDMQDGDQTKHAWLWTTNSQRGEPFEFDGFRVFTWNTRRHRYETVYRERGLTGYYPVEVSRKSDKNVLATFSIVSEADSGLVKKTYAFTGYRVSLVNKEPYSRREIEGINAPVPGQAATADAQKAASPAAKLPWYSRAGARIRSWFRR